MFSPRDAPLTLGNTNAGLSSQARTEVQFARRAVMEGARYNGDRNGCQLGDPGSGCCGDCSRAKGGHDHPGSGVEETGGGGDGGPQHADYRGGGERSECMDAAEEPEAAAPELVGKHARYECGFGGFRKPDPCARQHECWDERRPAVTCDREERVGADVEHGSQCEGGAWAVAVNPVAAEERDDRCNEVVGGVDDHGK